MKVDNINQISCFGLEIWRASVPAANRTKIIYKNLTLSLTTLENWLEYCVLKFQSDNQFMYDLPWELNSVEIFPESEVLPDENIQRSRFKSHPFLVHECCGACVILDCFWFASKLRWALLSCITCSLFGITFLCNTNTLNAGLVQNGY